MADLHDWTDGDILYSANLETNFKEAFATALAVTNTAIPFTDDFSSDTATTKTNLTHNTTFYNYHATNASITFESAIESNSSDIPFSSDRAHATLFYEVFDVHDEFEDASVDGALWSTYDGGGHASGNVTVSETGGYLQAYVYSGTTSGQGYSGGVDTDTNFYGDDTVVLEVDFTDSSAGNGSVTGATIQIYDGSSVITATTVGGNNDNQDAQVILKFNQSAETVTVSKKEINVGVWTTTVVDLSTLTTTWKIRMRATATNSGGGSGNAGNAYMRYHSVRVRNPSPTTTVTTSFSFDSGTNYSTEDSTYPNYYYDATNTGASFKLKATATVASDEVLVLYGYQGVGLFE